MIKTSRDGAIAVIGIDIGKTTFHLIGLDARGAIVLRQKLRRGQLERRLANLPPCLIGMEACVGAHHLRRRLLALGHDARLMPARYVRAYGKGQKNDFRDAEAIAEAVQRPTMRFVGTKSVEQLDLQALHRVTMPGIRHAYGQCGLILQIHKNSSRSDQFCSDLKSLGLSETSKLPSLLNVYTELVPVLLKQTQQLRAINQR